MLNCFCGAGDNGGLRAGSGAQRRLSSRVLVVACIALAVWLYLLLARGAFWRCTERDDRAPAEPRAWPRVVAVVPARNEADHIAESVGSLLAQDYRGPWAVVLVDDDSEDGTADAACRAAKGDARLHVVQGLGLPAGWTGKLWALKQGIDAAMALPEPPDYLLLTDADIVHADDPSGAWSRVPRKSASC